MLQGAGREGHATGKGRTCCFRGAEKFGGASGSAHPAEVHPAGGAMLGTVHGHVVLA